MAEVYPGDSLERLQATQTDILKVVAQICDTFGLTWFADSGTCLGAVRHGAFIPWDDDIDIAMPLDDYRTFCEVAPTVLDGLGYGVYHPATSRNYPPLWAKVYKEGTRFFGEQMLDAGFESAIFIDVFCYFPLDSDEKKAKKQISDLVFWQRMSYLHHISHPYISKDRRFRKAAVLAASAAHRVAHAALSPEQIYRRFLGVVERGDGKGKWANAFYPVSGQFAYDELFPTGQLPFGDWEVAVPRDVHTYLSSKFGDYMSVPPEDKRFPKPPLVLDFGDGVDVIEEARG